MTRLRDFIQFTENQVASKDIDPLYPVIAALIESTGANREEAAWLVVHYLTFYSLPSAYEVWETAGRGPADRPHRTLHCATERRGHRDPNKLHANMRGWVEAAASAGSLTAFLFDGLPTNRGLAWEEFRTRVERVPGNGRWASYKLAELALEVLGAPLRVLDMGHAYSSGPRKGILHLWPEAPRGNSKVNVALLDEYSARLTSRVNREVTAGTVRVEHVETMLCDFNALMHGDYYTGRDIDILQAVTAKAPTDVASAIYAARAAALPHQYLGELGGWDGPSLERKRAYKLTRELIVR